ncbi:hypothetical protein Nepgr_012964 [Nepenthes gracilis]|uniref:Fatty acyl-CoA reductase n=1 Tax=Nepenthes gracilis TaxID=150966 RepID=A0AAD3SGX2_NEPGR|nr:hypothetical protein Nepgr_012964 [Nepenthes gracilis]
MELGSILQFLEKKTILVTGGAGFLAKIFVEKVLRSQPMVKKVYLLLRAPDKQSATRRLQDEVIGKDLFRVLKQKMGRNFSSFISEKITVVPGDISHEDLAIKDPNLIEEMKRDIDVIVNLAATTNFDERYDISLYLNAFGAKNVLNFAHKCSNIKVLVQVSTAYVSGERVGLISEDPYHLGDALNGASGLDAEEERKLVQQKLNELRADGATEDSIKLAMKDMGIERARKYGWPNVYVFTKALGEMILMQFKGNLPLVIVRPTIVTSTYKEPFPGWVEGIRTIDSLVVGYGKGRITCFLGDLESVVDVMPADLVINAIIVAMVAHANQWSAEIAIYQVGSSVRNPIRLTVIQDTAFRYFTKHPWVDKEGKPVIVGQVKVLDSMASFRRHIAIYYLLPLKGLELVNTALCQRFRGKYLDLSRKISFVLRLVDIYAPYLFFKGIYDDMNTEKLRMIAGECGTEKDIFYFDPKAINWEDYFMNTHYPGIVKYIFK